MELNKIPPQLDYNHLDQYNKFFKILLKMIRVVKKISSDKLITRGIVVLLTAYIFASLINLLVSYRLVDSSLNLIDSLKSQLNSTKPSHNYSTGVKFNYFEFREVVLDRHLFSMEGEFPQDKKSDVVKNVDDNQTCVPFNLDLSLLGIIFNQDSTKSVATIFDNKYKITDVYREGDAIIDHPATIISIERSKVVINNSGSIECLTLASSVAIADMEPIGRSLERLESRNDNIGSQFSSGSGEFDDSAIRAGDVVVLKDSYVESQLGEGFSNIIQSARFVPTADESGITLGFRVFNIKPNTLFLRMGLKNGDIIAQVNETSLANVEQGFALYQALQDENELTIKVLRNQAPVTIKVKIES